MKKAIIISIITSSTLFAATVDQLEIDQKNTVDQSRVNAAIILQGNTEIYGEADVTKLKIEKRGHGNVIENTIVNGAADLPQDSDEFKQSEYFDRVRDDSIITQGRTKIIDGRVNTVNIKTDNLINDGTTIQAARGNSVKIDQGLTLVDGDGQSFIHGTIITNNKISNVDIEGDGVGTTSIKQGNFLMVDEGAGSSAQDIRLNTTNRIENGKVGHADIKQAVTILKNGAVAEAFRVQQENVIDGDTEIRDFSEVSQGVTQVDNAQLLSLNQRGINTISDVQGDSSSAVDSKVTQAYIDVNSNSVVSLNQLNHQNIMKNVDLLDSTLTQDTVIATNESVINNFTQQADSSVINVSAQDSRIDQNEVLVDNSTLDAREASTSIQKNLVRDSGLIDAYVTQASVQLVDSQVIDLTVSEENMVNKGDIHNAVIEQGKVIVSSL